MTSSKNRYLSIRLTEDEYYRIKKGARDMGRNTSDYIRYLVFTEETKLHAEEPGSSVPYVLNVLDRISEIEELLAISQQTQLETFAALYRRTEGLVSVPDDQRKELQAKSEKAIVNIRKMAVKKTSEYYAGVGDDPFDQESFEEQIERNSSQKPTG